MTDEPQSGDEAAAIPVVLWDRDGDFDLSPWYEYHVDATPGSMDDAVEWIEKKTAAKA